MLEPRMQQQFYDTADALVQLAEPLARPLAATAEAVLAAITSGGKILLAATAGAQADALQAAALLVGQDQRQRPPLSALALGADSCSLMGLVQAGGDLIEALTRQLRALGAPGDVLVVFDGPDASAADPARTALKPLIEAAHARDMSVVVWHGCGRDVPAPAELRALLTDTDVLMTIEADRHASRSLVYRLGWQAVVEAIDMQLLGETE